LRQGRVDAVVFTSAVQMHNLYAVAQRAGNAAHLAGDLNRSVIASIGPVCSRTLRDYGVTPTLEANPPKLGPLLSALDVALSAA
jgi:uroporphyrinogen-III synthase